MNASTLFRRSGKDGAILGIIMITLLVLSMLMLSMYHLAYHSQRETTYEHRLAQAFWLAEAGVQWCISDMYDTGGSDGLSGGPIDVGGSIPGTFEVVDDSDGSGEFRLSIGRVTVGSRTIERQIRVGLGFLPDHFNDVIRAENLSGDRWNLMLSGNQYGGEIGPRRPGGRGNYPGGNDAIMGNMNINGSVRMYDDSIVDGLPAPNTYDVMGDVSYSGELYQDAGTTIAGGTTQTSPSDYEAPPLGDMNYADNNDYNVAQIFEGLGISSGRLPSDHPLYNVVLKNVHPDGDPTPGEDDYYFEPSSISNVGTPSTGGTPLHLGDDKTYYVDGHVWFHNRSTYGFEVDGQAVIVSTEDIHISDNLTYADNGRDPDSDLLALVALGEYDSNGNYTDGTGNIYFGDPKYGTLFSCDAFMFANNDFLYNTLATGADAGEQREPESGFMVFGNFMAMNRVIVKRDWYKPDESTTYRAAEFVEVTDTEGNKKWVWKDIDDGSELSTLEVGGLRHYAMQVRYDDRIRDAATQMSGLPKTPFGAIFAGMASWEEVAVD